MEEQVFLALADKTLRELELKVDAAADVAGVDVDIELREGGILQFEFADGSQIIVNRHAAAREIWVAARAGGFHFRPENGRWIDTRGGLDLQTELAALISQQAKAVIVLA